MIRRSNVGTSNKKRAGGSWGLKATVETKNNVRMVMRERGKIIGRYENHNIWLNLGREYLASLLDYISFVGPTPENNNRIAYMGVGIGGNQQIALTVANAVPLVTAYPGTNAQTNTDPTVTKLERPVRISGGSLPYPGAFSDLWLGQVQAPAMHLTATQVTFNHLFADTDISYSPFLVVPLSEIMLFTYAANPNVYNNTGVAYDTFPTISKTNAFSLEVAWTVLF
jgi:hypothetical protein